jgi:hypothetical protein
MIKIILLLVAIIVCFLFWSRFLSFDLFMKVLPISIISVIIFSIIIGVISNYRAQETKEIVIVKPQTVESKRDDFVTRHPQYAKKCAIGATNPAYDCAYESLNWDSSIDEAIEAEKNKKDLPIPLVEKLENDRICQHFLGEEAYDEERAKFIQSSLKKYCSNGTLRYWKKSGSSQ